MVLERVKTTEELLEEVGVSRSTLNRWVSQGILRGPAKTGRSKTGVGRSNYFLDEVVEDAKMVAELTQKMRISVLKDLLKTESLTKIYNRFCP